MIPNKTEGKYFHENQEKTQALDPRPHSGAGIKRA